VAALYAASGQLLAPLLAHEALIDSLERDRQQMIDADWPVDPGELMVMADKLGAMLDHYMQTAPPLPNLTRLEDLIDVPMPSRMGVRSSNRYRFIGFIDGETEIDGNLWLIDFKLRGQLTPFEIVQLQRQYRWYAWSHAKRTGRVPVGFLVDERLNAVPAEPRILKPRGKDGKPTVSNDKSQRTTVDQYVAACRDLGQEIDGDVIGALQAIRWQARHPIIFRDGELEEAGRELVSAARLIHDLDAGEMWPVRNSSPMNCKMCRFKSICAAPDDAVYVDSIFERTVPKRLRAAEPIEPPDEPVDEPAPPELHVTINLDARAVAEAITNPPAEQEAA
jgi:hypothetical protein